MKTKLKWLRENLFWLIIIQGGLVVLFLAITDIYKSDLIDSYLASLLGQFMVIAGVYAIYKRFK